VRDWREIARTGTLIGSESATLKIVEFSELECPFCRRFHEGILKQLRARFGDRLALVYMHYPIQGHRFARPAARAAECAKAQGRFGEFIEAVYAKQDSLGLKTWQSYGEDAGVADTTELVRCASKSAPIGILDEQVAIGKKLSVLGTPTIMVNGWKYPITPDDSTLLSDIDRILKGEQPSGAR
jgi:protein-disulfide isomerase